ncbi:MAG: tRNA threonylcarbamoyladenosine dehydratase [Dysgonamonadaceae bacterium]|nr:tRNA threonylcarbamoyladenosine dehydratase [Dysgonamonadaceae bacterium]
MKNSIFQRTELLLGEECMKHLSRVKVIVFGVGGVGSWCIEALVRSGIKHITIVDSDTICDSNINRQLHATTKTIGQSKTEIMQKRLQEINPGVEVIPLNMRYNEETSPFFNLDSYDYIIDAIDSLSCKTHLIQTATRTNAVFFSSMGAALKMDPSRIQTAEFWKVHGCPLAAALRRKLRKEGVPRKTFTCVFSDELLSNRIEGNANGTLMHVTASFGLAIAGLVIKDVYKNFSGKQ